MPLRPDIQELYPGLSEVAINAAIETAYNKQLQCRPWFLPDGCTPAIHGAPENLRNIVSTQRQYARGVLEPPTGYILPDEPHCTYLSGGKQLSKVCYLAPFLGPKNPNVLAALKMVYPVNIRSRKMPPPVRKHVLLDHKTKHGGVTATHTEGLRRIAEVEAEWGAHLDKKNQ